MARQEEQGSEQEDAHDHDHGELKFAGSTADAAVLESLAKSNAALAENLTLAVRFGELDDAERARLVETQSAVETDATWTPGYHADGDLCGGCGERVDALFVDTFENGGNLEYAAFALDLPVHADAGCVKALRAKYPRPAPQVLDRARRGIMPVAGRPTARLSQFFRHDMFAHPPFGLEDWANSVAEANPAGFDRAMRRDMERLLSWVHHRAFHHQH